MFSRFSRLFGALALAAALAPFTRAATMAIPQFGSTVNPATIGTPNVDEVTPEIQSLADGIAATPSDAPKWQKCFEFVRDHIAYEHYFGCKRGALLTLTERRGSDADQAALLASLLKASGYQVRYVSGLVFRQLASGATWTSSDGKLTYGADESWASMIGAANATDASFISQKMGFTVYTDSTNSSLAALDCTWVEVNVDGAWTALTPAVKARLKRLPLTDMAAASGYDRAAMLTALKTGSVIGTNSITSLNESQLNTYLAARATALTDYINASAHEKLPVEFSGGVHSTPFLFVGSWLSGLGTTTSASMPESRLSYLTVQVATTTNTKVVDWRVPLANLQGRRLSITFADATGATVVGQAKLWLDDTLVASESTAVPIGQTTAKGKWIIAHPWGAIDSDADGLNDYWEYFYTSKQTPSAPSTTGFVTSANTDGDALTNLQEYLFRRNPFVSDNGADGSLIGGVDQVNEGVYDRKGLYAIIYGFGSSKQLLGARQARLAAYRQAGLADNSREVVCESLNTIGLNWFYQTDLVNRLVNSLNDCESVYIHRFGRVGQERGYYIDVPGQVSADWSCSGDAARSDRVFVAKQMVYSAMEHAVVQQSQDATTGAASTASLLRLASRKGYPVYFATKANWADIKPSLLNYAAADITEIEKAVGTAAAAGGYALVPQRGNLTDTGWNWTGAGYFTKTVVAQGSCYKSGISGNLNGGYSTSLSYVPPSDVVKFLESYAGQRDYRQNTQTSISTPVSYDPIDMGSGHFISDSATDMTIGAGAVPRGLAFSRFYHAGRNAQNTTGLGYGWMHNFEIRATRRSAFEPILGEDGTVVDVVPGVIAAVAFTDVLANGESAETLMATAMIADWLTDQFLKNAVSISIGEKNLQFIKRPDGTWQPPAQCTMTLAAIGNADGAQGWTLTERNGGTYAFDAAGRLTTVTDLWNKSASLAYASAAKDAKLTSVTDAYGRALTFTYDASGNLTGVSDGTRSTVYTYDANQNLVEARDAQDAAGKGDKYAYDDAHRITEVRNPDGGIVVQNFHDSWGRVTKQYSQGKSDRVWTYAYTPWLAVEQDPLGGATAYIYDDYKRTIATTRVVVASGQPNKYLTARTSYDGQSRVTGTVSPLGKTTSATYDRFQNLLTATDALGQVTTNTYDALNRLVQTRDPLNGLTAFEYNAKHQVTKVTDPLGNFSTTVYNTASGTPASVTNAGGKVTTFAYDAYDRCTTTTNALGGVTSVTYNTLGDALSVTDTRGNTASTTYNNRRQPLVVTAPGAVVVSKTYDDNRRLASVTDPKGAVTAFTYTYDGSPLTVTRADGSVITTVYDIANRPLRTTDSLGRGATTEYRSDGTPLAVRDPHGRRASSTVDDDGLVTATTDPLGATALMSYDALGRLTAATDRLGKVSQNTYDALGRRTGFTNRRGFSYAFEYDALGRLKKTTTPEGKVTTAAYDARGLVTTATQPSLAATTFVYDDLGRLLSATDPVGAVSRTYDAAGNLLTVTEGGVTITRTYDALNRVVTADDGRGNAFTYAYDKNGNLTALGYATGKTVTYAYDSLNRLTSVIDWTGRVTSFNYDAADRMTALARPNGTRLTRTYDVADQLVAYNDVNTVTGATLQRMDFGYDLGGRLVSRTETPALAPLARARAPLATRTGTYSADNRLATATAAAGTAVALAHDTNGNLTTGPSPLSPTVPASYGFDARNRVTSVTTAGASGVAATTTYGYDAEGNRIRVTEASGTTTYVVNPQGGQVLWRTRPNGTRTYYIYAGTLLHEIEDTAGNPARFYHYDQTGSTVALSNDAGTVTGRLSYSAYGVTLATTGAVDTPYRWNGAVGIHTEANGLLYMRARYYHPSLGRFIAQDPLGLAAGPNVYAYCGGDPIRYNDPSGLCRAGGPPVSWGGAAVWEDLVDRSNVKPVVGFTLDIANNIGRGITGSATSDNVSPFMQMGWYGQHLSEAQQLSLRVEMAQDALNFGAHFNEAAAASAARPYSYQSQIQAQAARPVKVYDVGLYSNLKGRSIVGDGLDLHHVGQAAVYEQLIPGYNRKNAPAIALPEDLHKSIPTVRGPAARTARQQLAKDIIDLRIKTDAPNAALQNLIELNKVMYPEAFEKK